jgi:hypothetical protein
MIRYRQHIIIVKNINGNATKIIDSMNLFLKSSNISQYFLKKILYILFLYYLFIEYFSYLLNK